MNLYKTTKQALLIHPNAHKFLNGITSNTTNAKQNAFLTIHGKVIATFDQLKISEDQILICIESFVYPELLKHLDMYLKLSKTKIEMLKHHVYFCLDELDQNITAAYTLPQKKGNLILTQQELASSISLNEFTLFRLQNNIPLHGIDYQKDFLLNISMEDHVSFTKGCYLGQELISKVYSRSQPSKTLIVKYEKDCSEAERSTMTSKTCDPTTQQNMGFVFTKGASHLSDKKVPQLSKGND